VIDLSVLWIKRKDRKDLGRHMGGFKSKFVEHFSFKGNDSKSRRHFETARPARFNGPPPRDEIQMRRRNEAPMAFSLTFGLTLL